MQLDFKCRSPGTFPGPRGPRAGLGRCTAAVSSPIHVLFGVRHFSLQMPCKASGQRPRQWGWSAGQSGWWVLLALAWAEQTRGP